MNGIREASDLIANSEYTVVLTGAGISTGSGLPDFRSGETGIWEKFDPDEVATLTAFRHNPYKFYDWLYSFLKDFPVSLPNPAHNTLAEMEARGLVGMVITQNVDGLHQASGTKNIIEVHGSVKSFTCVGCYTKYNNHPKIYQCFTDHKEIPICPKCDQILKPDVILFGEQLPIKPWRSAETATNAADLFIVVGSSLEVMPVATLPARSRNDGARLIILNNERTYIDEKADIVIYENVEDSLPLILAELDL